MKYTIADDLKHVKYLKKGYRTCWQYLCGRNKNETLLCRDAGRLIKLRLGNTIIDLFLIKENNLWYTTEGQTGLGMSGCSNSTLKGTINNIKLKLKDKGEDVFLKHLAKYKKENYDGLTISKFADKLCKEQGITLKEFR